MTKETLYSYTTCTFPVEEFGIVGERIAINLYERTSSRERKQALTSLKETLYSCRLVPRSTKVLAIGLGCDTNGKRLLVVSLATPIMEKVNG